MPVTEPPRWDEYEYPNSTAPAELRAALEQLGDASLSTDELQQLLYSEVLGLVTHQGDVLSGVRPLVDALGVLLESGAHAPELPLEVVSFLEYVFCRWIRDERSVLVRPQRYGACDPRVHALEGPVTDAYRAYQRMFVEQISGRLPPAERHADTYYQYVLGSREQLARYLRRGPSELVVDEESYASLAIARRLHAELDSGGPGEAIATPAGLDPAAATVLDAVRDPARGLDAELSDVLRRDEERAWYWAQGSLSVIGAVAAVLNARRRPDAQQLQTLEGILAIHEELRRAHADDEVEIEFAAPQALLEDVSALVFLEHLGRGAPLPTSQMTPVQARFFELMSTQARTHTYAMLHAGVLPAGLTAAQADQRLDIHRCYD